MKQKLPCWRRGVLLVALIAALPALAIHAAASVKNPTFLDADGDGDPDGWKAYPPANGDTLVLASKPGGGLVFKDNDKNNGLGLEQWVPVQEGYRYTVSAAVSGTGAVSLTLFFVDKIPAKAGDLGRIKLSEKTERAEAGKTTENIAVAPAGAKWMKLWLYCPKIGTTDVVVDKVGVVASEAPVVAIASPSASSAPASASVPSAPVAVAPTGPVPQGNLLENPVFTDGDGDGMPDGWNPYPPGDGDMRVLASAPGGGVIFKDNDKNNGLGLEQWVPVEEGFVYTAAASVSGNGAVNINLIFASAIPNRPGDLDKTKLSEKSVRAVAGKESKAAAAAPAGAKWLKVWFYYPKIGITDIVINQASLTASMPAAASAPASSSASSAAAAAPLPPGLAAVIDFETNDFSQGSHGGKPEGGEVTIITAADGPVRDGKYAAKAALKLDKRRAEVAGHRSEASGVARYGWSLYIPKEFDAFTHFSIITQWHSWGSGRESPPDGGPPTCITISKGTYHLKLLAQGDEGWTSKPTYFPLGSVDDLRGRWNDFVMEVNWQGPGKGGWLKLYREDKLLVDFKGTTWYDGKDTGPFFKFGTYKGGTQWRGTEEGAVLYMDAARMALGESSTYQMVDPKTYAPRPVR
jgi:hypothetical protein